MTSDDREAIRVFFARFRTEWYDLGFADPVEWSAIHLPIKDSDPGQELRRRLSYLTGAADMARLGNAFMSTQYLVAATIGNLCRAIQAHAGRSSQILDVYEKDIRDLLVALAATVRAA